MALDFFEDKAVAAATDHEAAAAVVMGSHSTDVKMAHHTFSAFSSAMAQLYAGGGVKTLAPALPLLFNLRGLPYSLKNHFVMEPVFKTCMPRTLVLKCGRQVAKSQSIAAQTCALSGIIPHFYSLYVAPRFEQTRRFSNDYIKPLLNDSPIGALMLDSRVEQSVLQRSFSNKSIQYFSYAFLDCERIRGLGGIAKTCYDEAQDINPDFIPVINEVMSHPAWGPGLTQFTGTPKTFDNLLQYQFEKSSQAEWVIRCEHCGKYNICCVEAELLKMIQPQGISCAKCAKLLNPRCGHWEHRYPERVALNSGYHIPQPIMPVHYDNRERWLDLIRAQSDLSQQRFYNEKLGEAFDTRSVLLSRSDLARAAVLKQDNSLQEAIRVRPSYHAVTMGVDWGGGGEAGESYTAVAVVGHKPDGRADVIYMQRIMDSTDPLSEAALVLRLYTTLRCDSLAHDFGGAGGLRETLLIQAGMDLYSLFPIMYTWASASNMVTYKAPGLHQTRGYYSVDKTRSLTLMCQLIRYVGIAFPRLQSWEALTQDFLALVEHQQEVRKGSDVYLITKKSGIPDDTSHAVNFAMLAYWERQQRYPDLSKRIAAQFSALDLQQLCPDNPTLEDYTPDPVAD